MAKDVQRHHRMLRHVGNELASLRIEELKQLFFCRSPTVTCSVLI